MTRTESPVGMEGLLGDQGSSEGRPHFEKAQVDGYDTALDYLVETKYDDDGNWGATHTWTYDAAGIAPRPRRHLARGVMIT
jgi:hypothetical protein